MQRLADQLIGDMGAVEVAGVDMVNVEINGLAQHSAGFIRIGGWTKDTGAGELHCAIADPVH